MIIDIKGTELEISSALRTYIEKRLQALDHLLIQYEVKNEVHFFVEIARVTQHHQKGKIFYAEVMAELPHYGLLRAEASEATPNAAIDAVQNIVKREIKKFKEKYLSRTRRPKR